MGWVNFLNKLEYLNKLIKKEKLNLEEKKNKQETLFSIKRVLISLAL